MTARDDFLAGGRRVAPLLVGVAPFGLVAGVTAVAAGLTPVQAVGMSLVMFAGASQLAVVELVGTEAPAAVLVGTALVVNLRFVMYSASIAPHLRRLSPPAKWVSAYLLTDQAYAVSVTEFRENAEPSRLWFYLGAAVALWVVWQVATAAGALLGAGVPPGLSLEFAVPLTFLALLVPAMEDRPTAVAGVVAGAIGVVAAVMPFNLGLVTAAVAGIAAGVGVERARGSFPTVAAGPGESSRVADADDESGGADS